MTHPKHHEGATVEEIMTYWSRGNSMQDTADRFGTTYKTITHMVARYGHRYERSFNFPHIIHAKRFGA